MCPRKNGAVNAGPRRARRPDGEPRRRASLRHGATPPARASFRALGTLAVVSTARPGAIETAARLLLAELALVDAAASRFRPDSEVCRLARANGEPVVVSELLYQMVAAACEVAELTGGVVDPTVTEAMCRLGYDRDFSLLPRSGPAASGHPAPVPGRWSVRLDPERREVAVPPGLVLDLGSSGKAFAADRAARQLAGATGGGVLVSLGGDVAVAGEPPSGGWHVSIDARSDTRPDRARCAVSIREGGLATSSTTVRSWARGGRVLHHILDPWTGEPAPATWGLVSVAAPSCLLANAASTPAVVWGEDAVDRLIGMGVAARLVAADGGVTTLGGWPTARAKSGQNEER
jgi:thiamine biosynthesis lipoprotein